MMWTNEIHENVAKIIIQAPSQVTYFDDSFFWGVNSDDSQGRTIRVN